jgi:hypothetical protein
LVELARHRARRRPIATTTSAGRAADDVTPRRLIDFKALSRPPTTGAAIIYYALPDFHGFNTGRSTDINMVIKMTITMHVHLRVFF